MVSTVSNIVAAIELGTSPPATSTSFGVYGAPAEKP
jgi:hypothetical protein